MQRFREKDFSMAGEKKTKQLSIRVHDSLYDTLENIADSERRKLSEISLALLERGIIAYKRDHKLFEYPSGRTAILRFPFEGPWPSEPGVFHILAKNNGSIFVGESENIAAEMKHLHSTEKHRLHKYHPEIIVVEYISNEEERKKRAERLIIESHPAAQLRPIRHMITYIETRKAHDR